MKGSASPWRVPIAATLTLAAILALPRAGLSDAAMASRVEALVPALEAYVEKGMKDFDDPGLAIGIVTDDRLVYARGFGTRTMGGAPVDTETLFQIGSTTKAFLATTMAIGVDRKAFAWTDRIVDLYPDFQLADGWVTREFRLYDIAAQRSGLPTYANDTYGMLGAGKDEMIRSLRHVEPASSFRADFTYTNITHLVAGDIVAEGFGAPDWPTVLRDEILKPLGMDDTSWTLEAMTAAPNHAVGHLWSASGSSEVPFTRVMPYEYAGAGAINSNIEDLQHWVRMLLADGVFEGNRIVSTDNLAVTRMPRVPIRSGISYAMGWIIQSTPNGEITWHNGGTTSFGTFIGLALGQDLGVVVLSNQAHMGLPDAIGKWVFDRLLGNPEVDYAAADLEAAKEADAAAGKMFDKPADALPPIPLAPLAGDWTGAVFGESALTVDGESLRLTLSTGAVLALDPWNGDVFTVRLLPEGDMAAMAANFGPLPLGFAQFEVDATGQYRDLDINFLLEPQEYRFRRE